ncbi:hypothetical protein GMST_37860 [Geomonas silvestris]|uniref:Lipoprotein n=1 Tax=Geomonas silvestris TaxID=2740184 RepID=A0A6V8MNB4_9BACT|nr:hypothetical protein [Geomonas silvestris]GFO61461.1 hypothetical protein GMST_37860 [Geomonas silvestris]
MRKLRHGIIAVCLVMITAHSAVAGVSVGIGIGLPNVSIGINLPLYPDLSPIPGYPVYYAPRVSGNYFFYDGMYWVFQNDNWYASTWYNGPWGFVDPMSVPAYVLRVPVSYYRQPPTYFRGWQSNAPPRWGQHWGRDWEQRRSGWDHWKRGSAPRPAPLPTYQRQYSGDRYPRVEQQHQLHSQQYRYQPRDKAVRQHVQQIERKAPAAERGKQERPQARPQQQNNQHPDARQQGSAGAQRQQQAPAQQYQQREQAPAQQQQQRQQQAPPQQQRQQAPQGHERQQGGGGQEREQGGGQERGQGHDR